MGQFHAWPKDRIDFKISHFAALILPVDIQTKLLLYSTFRGIHQDSRSSTKITGHSDRPQAQNFEAVLAATISLAEDTMFAKSHQRCINTLRHKQERYRDQRLKLILSDGNGF